IDGRSAYGPIGVGVGMHGHEHVGLLTTRPSDALAQLDKSVILASQHGAHARLSIDAIFQAAGDRQRHMLFIGTALADRARIDTTVTRVDRDYDVSTVRIGDSLHD